MTRAGVGALLLALLPAAPARALEALDDAALSGVQARDGITIDLSIPTTPALATTIGGIRLVTDGPATGISTCTAGGTANRHACTQYNNISIGGSTAPLDITTTLDVGSTTANEAGVTGVRLDTDWQNLRYVMGGMTVRTPTQDLAANSIGSLALIGNGSLHLFNQRGFFNNTGNTANFRLSAAGDLIYRAGAAGQPELSFGNLQFNTRFSNGAAGGQLDSTGKVAIDAQGFLLTAPYTDTDLLFDVMYKASPTNFDTTGRSSVTLFGWTGGLVNPTFRVRAGGVGYGTYVAGPYTYLDYAGTGATPRSQGINVDASWDFDSDFSWVIGQAGGNRTQVRFSNWRKLDPASTAPMLSMPVIFDVLQNNSGPTGLCFGGGFASGTPVQASCTTAGGSWNASTVPAGKAALAVLIRDGYMRAYNQTVEVFDPTSVNPYSAYRWSLLYTFGKLDADIFMYPEGRNQGVAVTTNSTGLKADITLMAQSPGFWAAANSPVKATRDAAGAGWRTNTHFMIADTAVGGNTGVQYGVGMVNADLLWRVRDMYFRVVNTDTGYPTMPGGLWLQTDSLAQYRFRGLFGGGNLNNLATPTAMGLVDMNLETSRFIFALSPVAPVAGDAPVGFSGLLDFNGNASFSLAEVSSPSSAFNIYGVSGRVGWANGRVNLVSSQNSADGLPRLQISNDLLFGTSATFGGAAGTPLVGNIGFGNEYFGRMTFPSGTWNSSVTLRIPGT